MSKKKIIIKAFLTVFCCFFLAALSNAETCSTAGQVQYKYTAGQPDECSYKTQTRTCCATTGAWSGWGEECPKTCDESTKPAATENCGEDNSGTRSRTVTCDTSTLTWKTGSWGVCSYCTPGAVDTTFGRCENFLHQATCNYSGTAWNCACMNKEEQLRCSGFWSPTQCSCICCPSGTMVVPDFETGVVHCEGIKNHAYYMPTMCAQ